jgi:photoactive yellow protein
MTVLTEPGFKDANLLEALEGADDEQLDALPFGAIGFDAAGMVRRYNAAEARGSGVSAPRNIGQSLFDVVAPCMNNFLVAQVFEDAAKAGTPLDSTIDYVLTLRMRPTKVKLRLLSAPGSPLRYVLIQRTS